MTERLVVGAIAPNLTLINSIGEKVVLADIWTKGTTFITFLRHFG